MNAKEPNEQRNTALAADIGQGTCGDSAADLKSVHLLSQQAVPGSAAPTNGSRSAVPANGEKNAACSRPLLAECPAVGGRSVGHSPPPRPAGSPYKRLSKLYAVSRTNGTFHRSRPAIRIAPSQVSFSSMAMPNPCQRARPAQNVRVAPPLWISNSCDHSSTFSHPSPSGARRLRRCTQAIPPSCRHPPFCYPCPRRRRRPALYARLLKGSLPNASTFAPAR